MRGDETLSQRPSNCILEIEIHPQKDVTEHIRTPFVEQGRILLLDEMKQ